MLDLFNQFPAVFALIPAVLRLPLFVLELTYVTWAFYLLAMSLIQAKRAGKLSRVATVLGYPLVAIGLVFDFALNVVASVVFLDPPRELLLTIRCNRYIDTYTDWRHTVAMWLCQNLLDPFEIGGHCHKPPQQPFPALFTERRGE